MPTSYNYQHPTTTTSIMLSKGLPRFITKGDCQFPEEPNKFPHSPPRKTRVSPNGGKGLFGGPTLLLRKTQIHCLSKP